MRRLTIYISLLICFNSYARSSTWREALETKKATINLAWYTSRPFVKKENGQMVGIEVKMMNEFQKFVQDRYEVELELNWFEDVSFTGIMERMKTSSVSNVFGISAFSITDERAQFMKFSDPYMPDITVLVSSEGTPIVRTLEEIDDFMLNKEAITIKNTTYEGMLYDLKSHLGVDFKVKYIPSGENILEVIGQADNRFGFIDLPIYLILVQKGGSLTRQNFFTVKGDGYGIIMPKHSDWDVPFNEFLADPEYSPNVSESISEYLGEELYTFIDAIYESDQISTSILTTEKELQLEVIKNANLELAEKKNFQQLLVIGMVLTSIFLVVLTALYLKIRNSKLILSQQKDQIENQQKAIAIKNEQLTNRNNQLIAINEDKNNLVHILAHDMRSPLGQIMGLTGVLNAQLTDLEQDHRDMLSQMSRSADRLNHMINKMLDQNALENHQTLHERVYVSVLLDGIVNRYKVTAKSKNIRIHSNSCNEHYIITTDHLLLLQVLENLISNAVKFSPPNSTIEVSADCREEEVVFSVKDEGPGFSGSDKELMFGRFQKLSAKPTGGESSVGLGLSIVKNYVDQLNGHLHLESEEGCGANFLISIPRSESLVAVEVNE